jgi:hypothetical protein
MPLFRLADLNGLNWLQTLQSADICISDITAERTSSSLTSERIPTERCINPMCAVKSFPGRTKLATSKLPDEKSEVSSGIAAGSPYGLLVIWQRIQSPRPASAKHIAGRTFDCERSENGKGTKTTSPAAGVTTLSPPRVGANPSMPLQQAVQVRQESRQVLPRLSPARGRVQ